MTRRAAQSQKNETEDETSQAPSEINYGPLPALVGYRIRKAYSLLFQTFTEMLKDLKLAPGQYSSLMLIGLNPGLSQVTLAEATGLDRSTIVPITNRFVKLGWVRRTRRKDDRRTYSLRLTPLGQSVLDAAKPRIQLHEARLIGNLKKGERLTLVELLSRITDPR